MLVANWLSIDDLCTFDTAVNNKQLRAKFLSGLSSGTFLYAGADVDEETSSEWQQTNTQWLNKYSVRERAIVLNNAMSSHLNATQMALLCQTTGLQHGQWEYFAMIVNLDAHIRCSAFVCTMRSNYCRLVDELRAAMGHKANRHYADLSCGNGCIDPPSTSPE
ncbi:hypothetical protein B484DRAFT_389008 [Ochromonadaceae sp. CCMP2298]|nr:hypothetical protein B484DRAFT_389008 [Ochromonadaceae sp. CCMP2298]